MPCALVQRASAPLLTQTLWCCVVGLMAFGCACVSVLAQPPKSLPVTLARQQAGFDCGSAALATLLSFYTDRAVEPDDLVRSRSFTTNEWQRVRREGFSLSQLADMAAALKVATQRHAAAQPRAVIGAATCAGVPPAAHRSAFHRAHGHRGPACDVGRSHTGRADVDTQSVFACLGT